MRPKRAAERPAGAPPGGHAALREQARTEAGPPPHRSGSIRGVEGSGAIFALALTGYAQPRDREDALAAGFDAHLPKPPPLEDLQRLLAEAARRKASRRD